jgi:hypothetical protein
MITSPNNAWEVFEILRLVSLNVDNPTKLGRLCLEFTFCPIGQSFGFLDFGIEVRNAYNNYRKAGECVFYPANYLHVKQADGSLIPILESPTQYDICNDLNGDIVWHDVKLIVDFSKGRYDSIIFDGVKYDISDIVIYDRASEGMAERSQLEIFFIIANNNGTQCQCVVDEVILHKL